MTDGNGRPLHACCSLSRMHTHNYDARGVY